MGPESHRLRARTARARPQGAPTSGDRSFRRYAVAALSVAALAAVSGCGTDVHPGQAAVVDGTRISMSDANSFSDDFCVLYRPILQQQKPALSMSTVRALALDVLVRDELVHQYAEDRGWTPPASYRTAVDGSTPGGAVPDRLRRRGHLPHHPRGRGVRRLGLHQGRRGGRRRERPDPGRAGDARGGPEDPQRLRGRRRRHLDPRFGTVSPEGQYFPSTGGLSVPVTTLAKGGANPADPQSGDTSYVDRCPRTRSAVERLLVHRVRSAARRADRGDARLRAECAWKAGQTHRSLARYLLEETHETLEAIDTGDARAPA